MGQRYERWPGGRNGLGRAAWLCRSEAAFCFKVGQAGAVEFQRLVGVYPRTGGGLDAHVVSFVARPTGGALKPQVGEVLELRYFAPDALPAYMVWWRRQQVLDAFNGLGGSVAWAQKIKPATDEVDLEVGG